ncbi:MAG: hypothetical protein ORO03_10005 [Alphaproteobacteria bacterium]|nr:hypothetical protein [Alphaproteobacteria bacterium]
MQGQYIDLLDANRDAIKLRNATGLVYQPRLNNQGSYSLQINYSLSPYPGLRVFTKAPEVQPSATRPPEPVAATPEAPPPTPPVGVFFDKSAAPAPVKAAPTPAASVAVAATAAPDPVATVAAPSSTANIGLVLDTVVS